MATLVITFAEQGIALEVSGIESHNAFNFAGIIRDEGNDFWPGLLASREINVLSSRYGCDEIEIGDGYDVALEISKNWPSVPERKELVYQEGILVDVLYLEEEDLIPSSVEVIE